jgi:uncharacterized membrane protein YjjB (DUF3815 family)
MTESLVALGLVAGLGWAAYDTGGWPGVGIGVLLAALVAGVIGSVVALTDGRPE